MNPSGLSSSPEPAALAPARGVLTLVLVAGAGHSSERFFVVCWSVATQTPPVPRLSPPAKSSGAFPFCAPARDERSERSPVLVGCMVFASTRDTAEAAAKRLRREYAAPAGFTWQTLRWTCGCYLTNAPGILSAASAYRSAEQLGHSVAVAEKHYVDAVAPHPTRGPHARSGDANRSATQEDRRVCRKPRTRYA
jgi:hypothetical protein